MFDMKESQLYGEVRFSKSIRDFRKELNNYFNSVHVVNVPKDDSALSTIEVWTCILFSGFQNILILYCSFSRTFVKLPKKVFNPPE